MAYISTKNIFQNDDLNCRSNAACTGFRFISHAYKYMHNMLHWCRACVVELLETLRSTTRPVRQRGSNFSSKMSAEHFDAVKVINLLRFFS